MSIRLKRLYNEYQEITQAFDNHSYIFIKKIFGNPPEQYRIDYQIKGLVQNDNNVAVSSLHSVEITLPAEYPSVEPMCRMITPVFHPNIDLNKICIADSWAAGESLIDVIIRIGEIISFQNYNIKSPLNGEAARWAEQNMHRFPIDTADLTVDRQISEKTTIAYKEEFLIEDTLKKNDLLEKVCFNCGAKESGILFQKCSSNHLICSNCIIECQGCGKALCILCNFEKCSNCENILCDECKIICTSCGNVICKDEICACNVCQCGASGEAAKLKKCSNGHFACPDCILECQDCGKILCVQCSFKECPYCGNNFCMDCHKTCASTPKIILEKTTNILKENEEDINEELVNNSNQSYKSNESREEQDNKMLVCKFCGYTTEEIEANFCEMCGKRLSGFLS